MDIQGVILSIAQQLAENLNAERCTIRVPAGEKMKLVAVYGINADLRKEEVDIAGTIVGEVFTTGKVQNIANICEDKRYEPEYIIHNDQKALLAIPLQFEDDILGVAQVYARERFTVKQIALAETLSQFAALILYYEQFRKTSHKAILKVVEAIIKGSTFEEISSRTSEQIVQNLKIERCTIYRIFKKDEQMWCEIAAGVPVEEHGIGLKEELTKHPDIQSVVESQKITVIDDLGKNPLTAHFAEIVRLKKINSILYVPVSDEIVVVTDATKEKGSFAAEEIEFCVEAGQILALVFSRIQADLQEWRDRTINPMSSVGGLAKRIAEDARVLTEAAKKLEQNIPHKI